MDMGIFVAANHPIIQPFILPDRILDLKLCAVFGIFNLRWVLNQEKTHLNHHPR